MKDMISSFRPEPVSYNLHSSITLLTPAILISYAMLIHLSSKTNQASTDCRDVGWPKGNKKRNESEKPTSKSAPQSHQSMGENGKSPSEHLP